MEAGSRCKRRCVLTLPDEDDLLQHLDVAYQREQWKANMAATRLRKRLEKRRAYAMPENFKDTSDRFVPPLSKEATLHCMELLQETLGADGLDECCCLMCDRLVRDH